MNQETNRPVLNSEGFHRLLAAAYLLQVQNDRQRSVESAQPVVADRPISFRAGAITQNRTQSLAKTRDLQPGAVQPDDVHDKRIAREDPYPARLVRFGTVRRAIWRTIEALTIAIAFGLMMGSSIHRLSALPDRTLPASGMLPQQNASALARPTKKVLAWSQRSVSRQLPGKGGADVVAADILVFHQERALNLPGQAAKEPTSIPPDAQLLFPKNATPKRGTRLTVGREADMPAGSALQYGSDVKMWKRKPAGAAANRSGD